MLLFLLLSLLLGNQTQEEGSVDLGVELGLVEDSQLICVNPFSCQTQLKFRLVWLGWGCDNLAKTLDMTLHMTLDKQLFARLSLHS